MAKRISSWILGLVLGIGSASAAEALKQGNNAEAQPRTPAEQLRSFRVPEGFVVELVASEETGLPKPVSLNFDDAGRLWTMTATEYPRDQDPDVWRKPGRDRIVVIDRPLGPGPHPVRTFADGMVLPMSVLPHRSGVIVAQGPEILFLNDSNGDGRADERHVLIHGFGVQDTHTLPHQLEWMPGNWVAFSQGVLNNGTAVTTTGKRVNFDKTVIARMRPDGSDLEVIGTGLNNIWAWAQDRRGQVFFHEANDFGYALVPFERDTSYPSFIKRLVHPDAPYHPPTTPELNLGGTGFSGLAVCEDQAHTFPPAWQGVFFVANPITRRINAVRAVPGPDGVRRHTQLPDLLATDDEFFRPVAVRFGPDGCLYIVDWYNRIISHNEIARDHPARDKTRGRIWRVRHMQQARRVFPNVAVARDSDLIRHLQSPMVWESRAAWHQIVERQARSLAPKLVALARSERVPVEQRILALWALEGLNHFDAALWRRCLGSPDADLRREAVRALGSVRTPLATGFDLLRPLADETAFPVRYEMVRYLRDCPEPLAAEHLAWIRRWRSTPDPVRKVKGWDREYLAPGGTYEAAFLNLLIQMAEEKGQTKPAAPVSSRWMASVGRNPPRPEAERAAIASRIAAWTRQVDAAKAADPIQGEALFRKACSACHASGRAGTGFAPSLAGSRNRSTEAILTAILDPTQAVEPVFRVYHVEMKDGETHDGFFGEESGEHLTLRQGGGAQVVLPIRDIARAGYIDGSSVMPEGLLEGLDERQVIDLVRHVQSLQ